MQGVKDGAISTRSRRARHAERPGFRISELQISSTQQVPWHYHTNVQDTFYVLVGRDPALPARSEEEVRLAPGQTYAVRPGRRTWSPTPGRLPRRSWCCRASANMTLFRWGPSEMGA